MLLMRADTVHARESGRGLGPVNQDFFDFCEMASSRKASAIWGSAVNFSYRTVPPPLQPRKSIYPREQRPAK
jgi:hypothetical protein